MESVKMESENKEKDRKIIDWIVKGILIIVIILLLLHNCELLKMRYSKSNVPTGNVDIIEIKCDKKDTCEVKPGKETPEEPTLNPTDPGNPAGQEGHQGQQSNEEPQGEEEPSEEKPDEDDEAGKLIVKDEDITWKGTSEVKIFTNSMYKLEDRIAPESSNTYQFVVKNSTNYNIKYQIRFIENNPYSINMKYKLKKNDTYLIEEYVSASELNLSDAFLNSSENDTYYLDWKWISSDNDTEIGANRDSFYGLRIEVKAESTNE